jgi:hypothetical protein
MIRKARIMFSLLLVALFLVSMNIGTGVVTSLSKTSGNTRSYTIFPNNGYSMAQEEPENGTYVWWDQDANSTADEWSWESKNWLFGPSPTFKIYHENGSQLTKESWAEISEELRFVVTVPKSIFTGGPDIGSVNLNGWYMTADWNFSASFSMNWRYSEYEWDEPWSAWSNWWNSSEGAIVPPDTSFLDLHGDQCTDTTDGERYIITFVVSFREHAPIGLYQLDMWVEDREYQWIGSYNYGSGWEFQGIAVGIPPDEAWSWSWGGSYTLQKLDIDGDVIHSLSRGKNFKMRFNITGDTPEYVTLGFRIPNGMNKRVNETGWHDEIITKNGGWVFDETLDTYVWDSDVKVTYMEQVYGEYETYRWIDLGTSRRVNVTQRGYNWYTTENGEEWHWDDDVVYNETYWVDSMLWYVWNSTTDDFKTYYGYRTYGYTGDFHWNGTHYIADDDIWNEEITAFEPVPEDLPNFYELNNSLCFAGQLGREFVVEFIGKFTDEMPKTQQYSGFYFEDEVMGPDGYRYYVAAGGDKPKQTWQEYELAKQITIESPVTIAKLLNEDGTQPYGYVFQADHNENFMIKGRLQGGGDLSDDIDGARVELNAYDGFWTVNESKWSQLVYEIVVNMTGHSYLQAFNMTEKRNWTYGIYEDYLYTNMTGWHYEYNETNGEDEWVYGEYWDWMWEKIEGWHWKYWYFNQLTQEWQEKWLNWKSLETKVPADFCKVTEFTTWKEGGDLYATFLVNMTETTPETNYWWEFNFLNNTWYTDYSSEYGEHEVMTWDREWVYSFEYEDERVYMDPMIENQLAFYNSALSTDYLLGKESPYIVVEDEELPIVVKENYDWWSGQTWTEMFFYDHWDSATDTEYYYYQLTDDTKVLVTYSESIYIYNVTLGTGESFLTGQEYDRYYRINDTHWVYYWIDIYGNIYQGSDWMDYSEYGDNVIIELYDKVEYEHDPEGYIVKYGESNYLKITNYWWESKDQSYYMTDFEGTLYQLIYNDIIYQYQAFIDGEWVNVDWPFHYYTAEYQDESVILLTWSTHRFWYHEHDAIKYEMPYSGANAEWYCDLAHTKSQGGKVPTTKSVWYDGLLHPVYNITNLETKWYVDIGLDTFQLQLWNLKYSNANGTNIWNPIPVGYTGSVGLYNDNLIFDEVELAEFENDYPQYHDAGDMKWNESGRHIVLTNGTIWLVNETQIRIVYEYYLDGTSFYSFDNWPNYWEVGNESGYFYYAINGTMINMTDWERLPVLNMYRVDTFYNSSNSQYYWYWFIDDVTYDRVWGYGQSIYTYKIFNASYSGDLYFDTQYGYFREVYQFNYKSILVKATASLENIYKLRRRWGYNLVYGPTPIESVVYKNYYDLVIGTPDWGLWGLRNWVVNEDNGALDLDGDLETINDQYYVKEIYDSTDSWNHTWSWMGVNLDWDPNRTLWGDEMHINSWMGLDTFTWSYIWEQSFVWYHVDEDITMLTASEMEAVKEILLTEEGEPQPGYWDVAWMAVNTTWEDILAEAEEEGWDWITSNEQTWTWLSFAVNQNYGTSVLENDIEHWINIGMHYEYSGLMLWEDLDDDGQMMVDLNDPGQAELSHYFIPDSVDEVDFVTPGMGYGNFEENDYMRVNLTDEVTWGVTFTLVNGTVFPFTTWGYWGWYDSVVSGSDMRTFDDRPTQVSIDELSFLVHFQGFVNDTGEVLNNYAKLKVDNYVGNWEIDMIGGRDNIENKSLALNYFADVHMSDWWTVNADGIQANNDQTVSAETFEFLRGDAPFAEMIMGGTTYDWSKNTTASYNVTSYTTPIGAFRTAFESEGGHSATTWAFSSTQYYLTIGFPEWDGFSVDQDPVFVSYISNKGGTPGVEFGALSISPDIPQQYEDVLVGIDITTNEDIQEVKLLYTTDFVHWDEVWMWNSYDDHWEANIPGFEDGTTVHFKIEVTTNFNTYESGTYQYTVGEAVTTRTPTTTSWEPSPINTELLILIGGGALVIIILVVLSRRRKSRYSV